MTASEHWSARIKILTPIRARRVERANQCEGRHGGRGHRRRHLTGSATLGGSIAQTAPGDGTIQSYDDQEPAGPRYASAHGRDRPRLGLPPTFGPHWLATELAALEAKVGIRAGQLDAWRDFTDNLQAVARPPVPPALPAPGAAPSKLTPFGLASDLAKDEIGKRGKAESLLKAIDALKSMLTPEQLDRLAFDDHGPPPPPPPE